MAPHLTLGDQNFLISMKMKKMNLYCGKSQKKHNITQHLSIILLGCKLVNKPLKHDMHFFDGTLEKSATVNAYYHAANAW